MIFLVTENNTSKHLYIEESEIEEITEYKRESDGELFKIPGSITSKSNIYYGSWSNNKMIMIEGKPYFHKFMNGWYCLLDEDLVNVGTAMRLRVDNNSKTKS